MNKHPYKEQPPKAFWSKSVSSNFNDTNLLTDFSGYIKKSDRVVSAGSCFASNLIPYLEEVGIEYLRTESIPKALQDLGENLGYANFSAAYGNIYTARQLRQLYERCNDQFIPVEVNWEINGKFIDPFRPGLKFPANSLAEFRYLSKGHLQATKKAFEECDVFVFTLGLTEGWIHKIDGATYPACPGTISGNFDPKKYAFKNFSVEEIVDDLSTFIKSLRISNPKVKFLITVSPVPLVATATDNHVLLASTYSKAVLRVAAEQVCELFENVRYFPAFEIITGPQAPGDYFEQDKRNVSETGVKAVMTALLNACGLIKNSRKPRITQSSSKSVESFSGILTSAECDEVFMDSQLHM